MDAWQILRERFGGSFQITQSFRQKLENWPKLRSNDATGLQKYADFLSNCLSATPYVSGLSILNDCLENQKMMSKLPDDIAKRWNRDVTQKLHQNSEYPNFRAFVTFVQMEARVLNNPVTSAPSAM